MKIRILSAGLYMTPQKLFQKTEAFFLGLNVSGVDFFRIVSPDGETVTEITNQSMFLIPPDFGIEFSYRNGRKNYVVICQIEGIEYEKESGNLLFLSENGPLKIPFSVLLDQVETPQYQGIFQKAISLSASPFPADNLSADLLISSVIARFLEVPRTDPQTIPDVLQELKTRIDSDLKFEHSLSDLMKSLPVTPLHLRRLFHQYYQTSPMEYRTRLRLARIREMLLSKMNFKEIAGEVGMNHVTHLYLFLQKHTGMTPAELRKSLQWK